MQGLSWENSQIIRNDRSFHQSWLHSIKSVVIYNHINRLNDKKEQMIISIDSGETLDKILHLIFDKSFQHTWNKREH